ncbi:MAG: class I SAM-dependent methyltransferase [Mariprofundaceae bacterium]|nr:class I SAM-dependent methyltransferase [Mariprofundaceae bacterium]
MRLTEQVHQHLQYTLKAGDVAVDATAGNGHDTLFLSQCVGKAGHIFAFDVQLQALEAASLKLQESNAPAATTWLHSGHEHMLQRIPKSLHGKIKAITFNLGYLPHTDKSMTTKPETTLTALKAATCILADGGTLSILAYTGHDGGREEAEAVKLWCKTLNNHFDVRIHIPDNTRSSPPEWICMVKEGASNGL